MNQFIKMQRKTKKRGFTLIELIIVIAILAVLAAMAQPQHGYGSRRGRATARQKACFSNQRVLQGAIEMYNMDNNVMLETALPGGDFGDVETLLIQEKYLKNYIEPPEEQCSYGFIDIDKTGSVFCKKHGTIESTDIDNPIIPEYDKSRERPLSFSYKETKAKIKREKEYQEFLKTTREIVISPPFLVSSVIFIIGFTLMIGGKKNKKAQ